MYYLFVFKGTYQLCLCWPFACLLLLAPTLDWLVGAKNIFAGTGQMWRAASFTVGPGWACWRALWRRTVQCLLPSSLQLAPPQELEFRNTHSTQGSSRQLAEPRRLNTRHVVIQSFSFCCSTSEGLAGLGGSDAPKVLGHNEGHSQEAGRPVGQPCQFPHATTRMSFGVGPAEECWHWAVGFPWPRPLSRHLVWHILCQAWCVCTQGSTEEDRCPPYTRVRGHEWGSENTCLSFPRLSTSR